MTVLTKIEVRQRLIVNKTDLSAFYKRSKALIPVIIQDAGFSGN